MLDPKLTILFHHFQVYEDSNNVYLITELLRGGELLDKILTQKRLSEREAADIMAVLVDTVAYLHRHGVINSNFHNCYQIRLLYY